jgi:hypothetical protein
MNDKPIKQFDPKTLAEAFCSVQPMPADAFANLYNSAKSREQLKEEGYEPVSNLGLMWIKKKDDEK